MRNAANDERGGMSIATKSSIKSMLLAEEHFALSLTLSHTLKSIHFTCHSM